MKEDFLHYVWKYQKLTTALLTTISGETVSVVHPGLHNTNAGPDFLNAQLVIDGQLWAGNVEIHVKSSDWYAHKHQDDFNYDSVLLHVVWEYNVTVFRENDEPIPTVAIKDRVTPAAVIGYKSLLSGHARFINCEQNFALVKEFTLENWLERVYIDRLQQKIVPLEKELRKTNNHWELLLFRQLCKTFGLKVNGESFASIAHSFPFSVVQKCKGNVFMLEALLFGQAGLLLGELEDAYAQRLQREYHYLVKKFKLSNSTVIAPKFFRLRPANFPTLRLSQLAVLYATSDYLFSLIINCTDKDAYYKVFNISASAYWKTHYNFGVTSLEKEKALTKSFIDLVLLNTVIPIVFCYAKLEGKDVSEEIIELAASIAPELNSIVKQFNSLRPIANNALKSQALLHLKKHYCDANRCLDCAVGHTLLHES